MYNALAYEHTCISLVCSDNFPAAQLHVRHERWAKTSLSVTSSQGILYSSVYSDRTTEPLPKTCHVVASVVESATAQLCESFALSQKCSVCTVHQGWEFAYSLIAQIAQIKWATVSESLRSKEWPGLGIRLFAHRSDRSDQMSESDSLRSLMINE